MRRAEWDYIQIDDTDINGLAEAAGLSPLIARLLLLRGVKMPDHVVAYLHPQFKHLLPPDNLPGVAEATVQIIDAAAAGDRFLVYGDYDVDGITATVLLYSILTAAGFDAGYYVPNRLSEGYGLHRAIIDKAFERGIGTIITVDCGTSDHAAVEYARSLGMKVIITDHHTPTCRPPEAEAIINPRLNPGDERLLSLAGVGVAFRLAWGLCYALGLPEELIRSQLDLVCLGTIADIVPLTGENRILASLGMDVIRSCGRSGIREFLSVCRLEPDAIDERQLAFILAPRLNAAGRMDNALWSARLLLTENREEAHAIARKLELFNTKRRNEEEAVLAEIVNAQDYSDRQVIVAAGAGWHKGVLGIVACRLTELYGRPAIVISMEGDEGHGSARGVEGMDILRLMDAASAYLLRYGGHTAAAGLTLAASALPDFDEAINRAALEAYITAVPRPRLHIDAVLQPHEFSFALLNELEHLSPFGPEAEQPVFIARDVAVTKASVVGKSGAHLKMRIACGEGVTDAIAFGRGADISSFKKGVKYDIVYTLEENTWQGRKSLQMNVRDYDLYQEKREFICCE
ncbi:MAG: single-stranded-DNA-specific exonuclease RecJ [bacterium]|nr:single-stranded-DNA-specific exonuclease RecJ [bacterium]MDD3804740.1 single-stranded-DNA-specific exonuclease RecJ [bacterium]MDD4558572.1 single-stranded-DNA-specific exonuclease RecJ [bacterium]